jgi:hypothetical protein
MGTMQRSAMIFMRLLFPWSRFRNEKPLPLLLEAL